MNEQRNTTTWVIGIIVAIVLIILGWWWWQSMQTPASSSASQTTLGTTEASTTPVVIQSVSTSSVDAIVASLSDGTTFNAYFTTTGVAAKLTGKGPYTVFVPSNEAFGYLPQGTLSSMSSAQLLRLVEYHVVSSKALNIDAVSSGDIQTLSKDMLNFQVNITSGTVQVGGAYALQEYKGSNGVVYLITAVNLPPQTTTQ